jgi:hypothetical protein
MYIATQNKVLNAIYACFNWVYTNVTSTLTHHLYYFTEGYQSPS